MNQEQEKPKEKQPVGKHPEKVETHNNPQSHAAAEWQREADKYGYDPSLYDY